MLQVNYTIVILDATAVKIIVYNFRQVTATVITLLKDFIIYQIIIMIFASP